MSSGTPSNPSVVSFVKYIRPDLDLEEIEHFVSELQGQGDVYEEALNIGKWQTVERQRKRETDVNDMQNQKSGKDERRNAGNQNRSRGTSRNRQLRRRGLRQNSRSIRRGGGTSRAPQRNSHRRMRRSDRKSKGPRPLAPPIQPIEVIKINSAVSAPTSSPAVTTSRSVKTFADCLRSTPSIIHQQPSTQETQSIGTPRSSPTRGGTEDPTSQPTVTAASTSLSAPPNEQDGEEFGHELPPNPLFYDAVSDFRSYSEPTTPESSCGEYETAENNSERYSSVRTGSKVHEAPQFPYTVQSPHEDHRILDPAQVLREFGASQLLAQPKRNGLPPGISTESNGKIQGRRNQTFKERAKQTDFKIGLPQNFVATPQQLEDLRNSFLSAANERESSGRTARYIDHNRTCYNQSNHKHLDGLNNRRFQKVTTPTNQHLLYHSRQRFQSHVVGKHTQELIQPLVSRYGDSLPFQNSLSALALTHFEKNNKKHLQHSQQYRSISTGYPLSMNSTTVPDLNSCNLDPNAMPWPGTSGWASHCAQPSYHLSQSLNRESNGCAMEPGSYSESNFVTADSMFSPVAYLRKLWGVRPGQTQFSYAPSPNSNNLSAFWSTNQRSHSQIKEHAQSQDGYPFYSAVN